MFNIVYLTDEPGYRRDVDDFLRQWHGDTDSLTARTSGSTGVPKEIHLPRQDMRVSARATNRRFGLTSSSRLLCPLSASYIAGKMMIARAIEADCEVAFCRPSNNFLSEAETAGYVAGGIDLLPIVPSQCAGLLRCAESSSPDIRNVIIGGAAIPRETEKMLLGSKPRDMAIYATYGMTETCSHVAIRRIGEERFTAMPGITFTLDERECLRIVAPEYSFWELQTNDIASLADSGSFIWRGRFDNVINSGGIKIFPEEVERKLEGKIPCRFYIKGEPDHKWGEAVTLVVEDDGASPLLSDEEILEICRLCLGRYEQPRHIRRIPEFATTSSGKLKRI